MDVKKDGSNLEVKLDGAIGESCPLFTYVLFNITHLTVDMSAVTFINSIGVKFWIMWTVKIPRNCEVTFFNVPFVIASQASMVVGFVTPKMKIESVRAPYACDACGAEEIKILKRGPDYEYANATHPAQMNIGPVACLRCGKGKTEPDFLVSKTFKFLDQG